MRRFRQGATTGPAIRRPGAGYGNYCCGAPGPTQEVQPSRELVPEMFTGEAIVPESMSNKFASKLKDSQGNTIIDITKD